MDRPVASYLSPLAAKGSPSAIEGRGLVATAPIAAGEVVAVKGGHLVDTATLLGLPTRLQNTEPDGLQKPTDGVLEGISGPYRAQQRFACQRDVRICRHV